MSSSSYDSTECQAEFESALFELIVDVMLLVAVWTRIPRTHRLDFVLVRFSKKMIKSKNYTSTLLLNEKFIDFSWVFYVLLISREGDVSLL